jgi:putative tryptophan/tyrosine transport system substrate-binding protein
MDRRAFIGSFALGTFAVPRTAFTQPARKVQRIGILSSSSKTSDLMGPEPRGAPNVNAFLRRLRELGYVYGEHFVTEPRGGESSLERFPSLAAEMVRLQVDVIVASGPMLHALKKATSTIPCVMAAAQDPVDEGLVRSLGRPGGNFTGLSLQTVETFGKRLELLKELVPSSAPVAILWDQTTFNLRSWQAVEAAAGQRGWKLLSLELRSANEIEGAFKAAIEARASALLVFAGGLLFGRARRVADLAAKSRLPTMYALQHYVEAGGLMAYGPDLKEIWRRAADFVDKILKGAKPADLPVEQPTKFELVINLKTAKALGLTIPPSVLGRADQLIE